MQYSKWLDLSLSTRNIIASLFGIPKKGPTHVVGNHVQDDGYFVKDIEAGLTLVAMQDYVGVDEPNMGMLFDMVVNKAEGRESSTLVNTEDETVFVSKLAPVTLEVLPEKEALQANKEYKRKQNAKTKNTSKK